MKRPDGEIRFYITVAGMFLALILIVNLSAIVGYLIGIYTAKPERPVTYTIIRVTGQKPAATLPKTVDALAKWRGLPGWKGVGR